jgi:hypothetical protein
MPPRGVEKGTKRARQYEHIKQSERRQGAGEARAEEIAARTVNKAKARTGESRTRSKASVDDISSGRRGGLRSQTKRAQGQDPRSALRRGAQARDRRTLGDEQGAAAAGGRPPQELEPSGVDGQPDALRRLPPVDVLAIALLVWRVREQHDPIGVERLQRLPRPLSTPARAANELSRRASRTAPRSGR